ncbi:hypothetical protein [Brenneria goodwinii]|uniref:hypothetical protein n=1 Tax=Brenneria goodwinii TaxID=1109412 RepID=UPI0036E7EFAF
MAENLAELANWSENTSSASADPAILFGQGAKIPTGTITTMLERAKKDLEAGLAKNGVKLQEVVTNQSHKQINTNLNYLEMKHYLNVTTYWFQADDNDIRNKLTNKSNLYFDLFCALSKSDLPPLPALRNNNSLGVVQELLHDAPGLIIGDMQTRGNIPPHIPVPKYNFTTLLEAA